MPTSKPNMRLVQLLVMLSGVIFIIAGMVLMVLNGAEGGEMMVFGIALLVVGFGDLVVAFFVFRGVTEVSTEQSIDLGKSEHFRD